MQEKISLILFCSNYKKTYCYHMHLRKNTKVINLKNWQAKTFWSMPLI